MFRVLRIRLFLLIEKRLNIKTIECGDINAT